MRRLRIALLATSALIPLSVVTTEANPLGPDIAAGDVSMDGLGSSDLTINQSSNKAIINWRTFNIDPGETTHFVQPGSDAVVLNRVTGGEGASQILGSLKANGQVFLINPDGILIGKDANIDVGALVATTHDLFDGDFLSGRYEFGLAGRPDASVVNLGTISVDDGGFAALVAPGVRNAGTITARLGKVSLASASSFTLDPYGDGLITLGLSDDTAGEVIDVATGQPLTALVGNDGLIRADGGTVELTAAATRKVIDSVVNSTGVIEADSVGTRKGKIVLSAATSSAKPSGAPSQKVKVKGNLSTAGKKDGEFGGTIQITGEEIALTEATIDAAGWRGGGTVLVGGDLGGGNSYRTAAAMPALERVSVPTANVVSMDSNSVIDASARVSGNGGKIILWSDVATTVDGLVSARGGELSGDGGFVETSGRTLVVGDRPPDTSVVSGVGGTWLLDPLNIAIRNATDINYTASGVPGQITAKPSSTGSVISASTINIALSAGTSVVVSTQGTVGSQAGDISLEANIASTAANGSSFVLDAAGSIFISPSVSLTSTGQFGLGLWLTAGNIISAGNLGTVSDGGIGLFAPNGISFSTPSSHTGEFEVGFGSTGGNTGAVGVQFANARVNLDYSGGAMFFRRYGTDITPFSFTEFYPTGITNIVLANNSVIGGANWAFPSGLLPSWSIGVTPSDFADGIPEVISPAVPPPMFSDPPGALSIPLPEYKTSTSAPVQFVPTSPRGVSLLAALGTSQVVIAKPNDPSGKVQLTSGQSASTSGIASTVNLPFSGSGEGDSSQTTAWTAASQDLLAKYPGFPIEVLTIFKDIRTDTLETLFESSANLWTALEDIQISLPAAGFTFSNEVQLALFKQAIQDPEFANVLLKNLGTEVVKGALKQIMQHILIDYAAAYVIESIPMLAPYKAEIEAGLTETVGAAGNLGDLKSPNPFVALVAAVKIVGHTATNLVKIGIEYHDVQAINSGNVERAIANASVDLQLQQTMPELGYRLAIRSAIDYAQIGWGLIGTDTSYTVDSGRKIVLASDLLRVAALTDSGRSSSADRASIADLVQEFQSTHASLAGEAGDLFLGISSREYADFANQIARRLGILDWQPL